MGKQLDAVDEAGTGLGEGRRGVEREGAAGAEGERSAPSAPSPAPARRRPSRRASRPPRRRRGWPARPSRPWADSGRDRRRRPRHRRSRSSPGSRSRRRAAGRDCARATTRGLRRPGDRGADRRDPSLQLSAHLVRVRFLPVASPESHDLFEHLAERCDAHRTPQYRSSRKNHEAPISCREPMADDVPARSTRLHRR